MIVWSACTLKVWPLNFSPYSCISYAHTQVRHNLTHQLSLYANDFIDAWDLDEDRVEVINVLALTTLLSSLFTQLLKQPQLCS